MMWGIYPVNYKLLINYNSWATKYINMFGLIFLITAVYGNCETDCYITCLSKSSLNTCSQTCCKFDHISFSDGKVFFVDGGEKLEIELEEVYFELPKISSSPKKTAEVETIIETKPEPVYQFSSKCEEKCSKYCKKSGSKCFESCNSKYCTVAAIPEDTQFSWITILATVAGVAVIAGMLRPKTYYDGYRRLD